MTCSVGGMMSFLVKSKTADSVKCEVVDGGELKSRRHLNVRGKSATLASITGSVPNWLIMFFIFLKYVYFPLFIKILQVQELFILLTDFICLNQFVAEKDWEDIKFGVDNQVDFYAVSFVKDAQVVHELKNYLQSKYFNILSYIQKHVHALVLT